MCHGQAPASHWSGEGSVSEAGWIREAFTSTETCAHCFCNRCPCWSNFYSLSFTGMWKQELFHFLLNNPARVMIKERERQ